MSGFPWRTALFASLALNLVVVSAGIGAFASGARLERPADQAIGSRQLAPRAFMQALPPETRQALRRELAGRVLRMREERAAVRAARRELYAATRAEQYDAERVRAAFAASRAADAVFAEAIHDATVDALSQLSADERRAAIDAVARSNRPRRGE